MNKFIVTTAQHRQAWEMSHNCINHGRRWLFNNSSYIVYVERMQLSCRQVAPPPLCLTDCDEWKPIKKDRKWIRRGGVAGCKVDPTGLHGAAWSVNNFVELLARSLNLASLHALFRDTSAYLCRVTEKSIGHDTPITRQSVSNTYIVLRARQLL